MFQSEKGLPLSRRTVHHIVQQAGKRAGFSFPVYPHMLRHACGYYLANRNIATRTIQAYMGHKNINNTVKYTALAANRFEGLWGN